MNTVIGIDYGTQSARALLVDAETGHVLASYTVRYAHGVMPGSLASAEDYENTLMELMEHVTPEEHRANIRGICVDATSLTLVPADGSGRPLALQPKFAGREQAQIKLWKRHAAQPQADEAIALARQLGEGFLKRTGGSISSEWTLPKILEIRDKDPEVYGEMDLALDLCEYLTIRLTGTLGRSNSSMCFKGLWDREEGFPSDAFLNGLRPGFAEEYRHLLRGEVYKPGEAAGMLSDEMCARFGLNKIPVAAGILDGHTGLVAMGVLHAGDASLVLGTSNVVSIQTEEMYPIEGICGIAMDGLAPGLYGIDSGQNCTGDMLEWYVNHAAPAEAVKEAQERGVSVHQVLCERIEKPWENKVTAADWWNGSRNAPCDLSLRGCMMGLSLETKAEEIYLALLQAIVCGTRAIIEQCGKYGVTVSRVLATGGIAGKNPLLMQEYANVLNVPVDVGQVSEGPALGAAIYAAVAAGLYAGPVEAHRNMGVTEYTHYLPDPNHRAEYEALYRRNRKFRDLVASFAP